MPKRSRLVRKISGPDFKWSGYQMFGTGIRYNPNTARGSVFGGLLYKQNYQELSVVDSSVGRALSFSHEGPRFKSRRGHLFVSLLI